jgi:hypothetical protein
MERKRPKTLNQKEEGHELVYSNAEESFIPTLLQP